MLQCGSEPVLFDPWRDFLRCSASMSLCAPLRASPRRLSPRVACENSGQTWKPDAMKPRMETGTCCDPEDDKGNSTQALNDHSKAPSVDYLTSGGEVSKSWPNSLPFPSFALSLLASGSIQIIALTSAVLLFNCVRILRVLATETCTLSLRFLCRPTYCLQDKFLLSTKYCVVFYSITYREAERAHLCYSFTCMQAHRQRQTGRPDNQADGQMQMSRYANLQTCK